MSRRRFREGVQIDAGDVESSRRGLEFLQFVDNGLEGRDTVARVDRTPRRTCVCASNMPGGEFCSLITCVETYLYSQSRLGAPVEACGGLKLYH